MSAYYWKNREELLKKAPEKYHKKGVKEREKKILSRKQRRN